MGVTCVHSGCGGSVVSDVKNIPLHGPLDMPFGPINENDYRLEVKFWCSKCGVSYKHPPGQPEAEDQLLTEERDRIAEVQANW